MDPARMFLENLTPSPELENSQGQSRHLERAPATSALPRIATMTAASSARRHSVSVGDSKFC
jgi:hypothetical protein